MRVKSRFKPKIKNKSWESAEYYYPDQGVIVDLFLSFTLIQHKKKTVKFFLYEKIG